jgi:hypothetical protein
VTGLAFDGTGRRLLVTTNDSRMRIVHVPALGQPADSRMGSHFVVTDKLKGLPNRTGYIAGSFLDYGRVRIARFLVLAFFTLYPQNFFLFLRDQFSPSCMTTLLASDRAYVPN